MGKRELARLVRRAYERGTHAHFRFRCGGIHGSGVRGRVCPGKGRVSDGGAASVGSQTPRNLLGKRIEVSREEGERRSAGALFHEGFGRGDSPAVVVAEDEDQRNSELMHREFQRRKDGVFHHLSSGTHDKEIAEPAVEHDLGRDARIGAREDRRERCLTRGQVEASILVAIRVTGRSARKSSVAFAQACECSASVDRDVCHSLILSVRGLRACATI